MSCPAEDGGPVAIYRGHVLHRRDGPQRHLFRLPVFSLLLDLDRLAQADRDLLLFAYNRFAPIAFLDRDHGPRDGRPLRPWLEAQLAERGLSAYAARLQILCFPRLFGHVFNPLSVYFCRNASGRLGAILYEVKNTFGGQHAYLLPVPASRPGPLRHDQPKRFYVSPFLGATGRYRFRILPPAGRFALSIRFEDDEGNGLTAVHAASRLACSDAALLRLLLRFPLQSLRVVVGIHWQAWKLWRKGARFHPRPPGSRPIDPGDETPVSVRP